MRERVGVVEALQGAGHLHRHLLGRVALDVLVEASLNDLVVHAADVIRNVLLDPSALGALEQEAAGLGLPVGEEDKQVLRYASAPEVLCIIMGEGAFHALQVTGVL